MAANFCVVCRLHFRKSSVRKCPRCDHRLTKSSKRSAAANNDDAPPVSPTTPIDRELVENLNAQDDQGTKGISYCLKHHALGHWEGHDCDQPDSRTSLTIPSMQLHWDKSDEWIAYLTRDPMPDTVMEAMAHFVKLYAGVTRARKFVLLRDDLLKQVRSIMARKSAQQDLDKWDKIMAEAIYNTHSLLCKLLNHIHRARSETFEIYMIGQMVVRGEWLFKEGMMPSHYAIACALGQRRWNDMPRLDVAAFKQFTSEMHDFADTQQAKQDLMAVHVQEVIADIPLVAQSFSMGELFRAPMRFMPLVVPPVFRQRAGIHVFAWPDIQEVKHHIDLQLNHP
ncbi:hypothetical protein PV05_06881 [Exophiala xenobiotica]|uniref:Uncharacterized protein n=1 Tax=Exophiala xenobiotica TaxID=348802 RepID=A0A0D2CWL3_9EURO|nr:uncharacterized protein PV05_06881 [Exophiala xenobiotica]KIW54527.1 hypothetical protein PV05_06881 [Exophiala xenobiotica]